MTGRGGAVCGFLRRLHVAYHEAGHAVVALVSWPPRTVRLATVVPDADLLGVVVLNEEETQVLAEEDPELCAARDAQAAAVCVAGHVAECRLLGGGDPAPNFWLTSDYHDLLLAARQNTDTKTEEREYALACMTAAGELLDDPGVRRAIGLVAGALLRQGSLSGCEVAAIVDEVGVEPDPERLVLLMAAHEDEVEDDEAASWERW